MNAPLTDAPILELEDGGADLPFFLLRGCLRPEMPIVYASGHWHPTDRDRPVPRSVFLPKPYDPRDAGTERRQDLCPHARDAVRVRRSAVAQTFRSADR